jgi:dihydrofolate reductase
MGPGGAGGARIPPYHHPVFVLTHHPREPLEMQGGTTFHFVSDGIARLVDEIDVSIAPVVLGAGARLFEGVDRGTLELKQIRAVDAPGGTHIKYELG